MKRIVPFIAFIFYSTIASSQIITPPLSQRQTVEQKVGYTEVKIEYCRPHMRGRQIFGGLETYGEVWRTGANRNTQISFNEGITVEGKSLPAGTYTLFTRPDTATWKVYLYPYDNGYGVPDDFSEDKAHIILTVPVFELNRKFENLTINLENATDNSADIAIIWESSYIAVPIKFSTHEKILSDIDDIVNDHSGDYYSAAKYYLSSGQDLEKAKHFIEQSIKLRERPGGDPQFWIFQLKAEILFANNENKAALTTAKKAMDMASSRGPEDMYVLQIASLIESIENSTD